KRPYSWNTMEMASIARHTNLRSGYALRHLGIRHSEFLGHWWGIYVALDIRQKRFGPNRCRVFPRNDSGRYIVSRYRRGLADAGDRLVKRRPFFLDALFLNLA